MKKETQSTSERPLIFNLLIKSGNMKDKDVDAVFKYQAKNKCTLEEAIIGCKYAEEDIIASNYANYFRLPISSLKKENPIENPDETRKLLPEKFARDNYVLPINKDNKRIEVSVFNPTEMGVVQEVQLYTGLPVVLYVSPISTILSGLSQLYGERDAVKELTTEMDKPSDESSSETNEDVLDLNRAVLETRDTQIIRLVNKVLEGAIREKASDIHIEPFPEEIKIRYRIDGVLNEISPPPRSLFIPLISRLKILCKMDIAEKRIPQDGAFSMKMEESVIDCRVSTCPTVHGEKMVMRLLNKQAVPLDLAKLGFEEKQLNDFVEGANSPHGLVFVTGPTGSGKSTTLYATLNLIKSPKKNIHTVEDPVEYKFTGINQVQVKAAVGLTFSSALRSFLRQDPDVIMVGEVRDQETAEICMRAALTGHLVLSTLHTNDALSAINRLEDMGIAPFLIASTLRVVEAQRLIRKLCQFCKEPMEITKDLIEKYGFTNDDVIYKPKGCDECRGSGYKGRVGVYEVIRITPDIADFVQKKKPLYELKELVRGKGIQLLFDNGLVKVRRGITSMEEVVTLTLAGGD